MTINEILSILFLIVAPPLFSSSQIGNFLSRLVMVSIAGVLAYAHLAMDINAKGVFGFFIALLILFELGRNFFTFENKLKDDYLYLIVLFLFYNYLISDEIVVKFAMFFLASVVLTSSLLFEKTQIGFIRIYKKIFLINFSTILLMIFYVLNIQIGGQETSRTFSVISIAFVPVFLFLRLNMLSPNRSLAGFLRSRSFLPGFLLTLLEYSFIFLMTIDYVGEVSKTDPKAFFLLMLGILVLFLIMVPKLFELSNFKSRLFTILNIKFLVCVMVFSQTEMANIVAFDFILYLFVLTLVVEGSSIKLTGPVDVSLKFCLTFFPLLTFIFILDERIYVSGESKFLYVFSNLLCTYTFYSMLNSNVNSCGEKYEKI